MKIDKIKELPHYLDDNGKAIKLTTSVARDIFAYMQAKFQRGDGKGHTDWVDNQMFAVFNKQYEYYLKSWQDWNNICGWTNIVVENLPKEDNDFFVIFYKQITPLGAVKVNAPVESEVE